MDMAPAMDHGAMPDASTSSAVRDPHAYADGYDFGPIPRPRFADEHNFASLLVDRLEGVRSSHNSAAAYDLQAWYGRDYDRAVLKAEGDIDGGKLQEARSELLWSHAVAPFWDMQLGVRYDSGVDPGRGWLVFAFQGLAPSWFEIDAAGYVGSAGHSALRLSAGYELLLTQRLILQPRLESDFFAKGDAERALGAGLSDVAAGIRLRYEIRREFAPYVGIEWAGKYGGTASYARAAGDATDETHWVAGLRVWF
jgi:copper resistance protein B